MTNAYAAVLMSFLTSAFFFDSTEDATSTSRTENFVDSLLAVLVQALTTTVLLLPFKHIIPYVVFHRDPLNHAVLCASGDGVPHSPRCCPTSRDGKKRDCSVRKMFRQVHDCEH